MSLLVLSPYLFYKWFQQPTETANGHLYRYSFIYGLTIGLCILTRASNALVVLMILAYVLVHGLTQKRIMSFLLNLITAMTGCLVICLPFVFYFLANDALDDLYDSVIVSNLAFITGLMTPLMHLKRAVALFCAYANVLAFVFLGILQLSTPNPKRMHGVLWFSMGIGCILFFICTNCYPNYAHICFPFAIIALLELKHLYQESEMYNESKKFYAVIMESNTTELFRWMKYYWKTSIPTLKTFIVGIRKNLKAVRILSGSILQMASRKGFSISRKQ